MSEHLYDHYEKTNELNRQAIKDRDRYFFIVCVILMALYLLAIYPIQTVTMISDGLKESIGVTIGLSINVIQVFVWLLLLWFLMRYCQRVVYIERQYHYLQHLEKSLEITREGDDYLKNYPAVLNYIHGIYQWAFPIIMFTLILGKIVWEYINKLYWLFLVIYTVLALMCLILLVTYWFFLRRRNK